MSKYQGYSYPKILQNKLCWYLWKKFQCKKGNHLWDEVYTLERHYPKILQNKLCWYLWNRFQCKKGNYLWSEVYTRKHHYLYCDACEKELKIV